MATLEKIRSKSVMLFAVIIVALLAFILGDFLTSGRNFFGPGDTVASADGVKVKFDEYQKRSQELSAQYQAQGQKVDPDVLSQMAIEDLLREKLMKQEYDRVGIAITDKQLHDLFYGQDNGMGALGALAQRIGTSPEALQSMGITTLAQYAEAMENPAKYKLNPEIGQAMKDAWLGLEDDAENNLRANAYGRMLSVLYTSSNIDRQAIYNDNNERRGFQYAGKSLASVADDDVKLQDADYQKIYDKRKGQFKLNEEKRYISYIEVPVTPSEKDFADAQQKFEKVVADLREMEGVKALTKTTDFHAGKAVKYSRASMAKDEVLRGMLIDSTALAAGTVTPLGIGANNTYRAAKVLDVTTGVDKVKYSMIMAPSAEIDSIRSKLTATTFDSIANKMGGIAGREMSLVNIEPGPQDKKMFDALTETPVGQVTFINDTVPAESSASGKATPITYAMLISERDLPVEVYNVTVIEHTLAPSAQTVKELNDKFHTYLAKNGNAKAFTDNAAKSEYTVRHALISNSTPNIGFDGYTSMGLPNSRGAVKWAMDNKAGKVSPVFSKNDGTNDYLLAVAVDEIYDGKYMPATSEYVREQIRPEVLLDKKAEKVIAGLKGKKTLAEYAAAMQSPVQGATSVFGDMQVDNIGFGLGVLQGAVAGAQSGKVVGPFRAGDNVYVIVAGQSTLIKDKAPANQAQQDEMAFQQKYINNVLNNNAFLLGNSEIENNLLKLTQDEK
ncbi:MAG: SurA N-terminal domain-containing protein [Muribaculaceae bacterium]